MSGSGSMFSFQVQIKDIAAVCLSLHIG